MKKLVIIPTYNERENVEPMIRRVMSLAGEWHLLVVDDNSPDGTASIVRALQPSFERLFLLERAGKQGLGTAYLAGFAWALERDYEAVFEMDCDFSHNPDDLPRLAALLSDGAADVAVGSRYSNGVTVMNWPMSRLLLSYCASRYVRVVTGMPCNDATAGFVGYTRAALEALGRQKVRMVGYGFQVETKYLTWRAGFRIAELPIVFIDRRVGVSKMSGAIFGEAFFGVLALPFRSLKKGV